MRSRNSWLIPVLSVALAAPLAAAGTAKQDFTLHLDPLVVDLLDVDVSTNSAKFREYRDIRNGLQIPVLRVVGTGDGGNRLLVFRAENVGRNDARYRLDYGVEGKYKFLVDYNKIQHLFGNAGHTIYTQTGPGRWEVPDPTQSALQSAIAAQYATNRAGITFSFLNGLLAPYLATASSVDLGLERDRMRANLQLGRMAGMEWDVEYTHEGRNGNRPYGSSFGFSNVSELPEPIHYDTTGATLGGEWRGQNGGMQFGYRYSKFDNKVNFFTFDNPFRAVPSTDGSAYTAPGAGSIAGPSFGQNTLAADNSASSLFWNGRARMGSWNFNGGLTYSMMKQNDALGPYTVNSAIRGIDASGATFDATSTGNLPVRNADEKVDVLAANFDLGSRFADKFHLNFRGRYYDYDNRSPRIEFPGYVRFDAVWEAIARITVPYSYRNSDLSANFGWDLSRSTTLDLTYARKSWHRDFREVKNTDDNVLTLALNSRWTNFDLRARYEHADRSIGKYDTAAGGNASFVEAEIPTNLPDLRKFDEAARKSDTFKVDAHWSISESLELAFGGASTKDDYDKSIFGLLSDKLTIFNAELDWSMGKGTNLYLFGTRTDRKSDQFDRQSGAVASTNPADSWSANFKEINDVWGLGINGEAAKKWKWNVGVQWSKSNGTADLFSPPGGTPDLAFGFGNYDDVKLFAADLSLDYQIDAHTSAGVLYRFEDYKLDSFIDQGLSNYLPSALLLDANNGNYRANVIGVRFRVAF